MKLSRFLIPLGALASSAGMSAGAAELRAPEAGSELRYECESPWNSYYAYRIVKNEGGSMRWEGESEKNKDRWTEKPEWAYATTLFTKKDSGDGKGERGQKITKGNLHELAKLEPGAKLKGEVREWRKGESWKWRYTLEVSAPTQMSSEVAGPVEVVSITEKRSVIGGKYRSTYVEDYAPSLRYSIGWRYKDKDGTETCKLAQAS